MKKVLFIAAISLALFSSCRESEKNETISNEEMMLQQQDSLEKVRAENKRMDSLQQVESHGHAH